MNIYSMLSIVAGVLAVIEVARHVCNYLSVREQCRASIRIYELQTASTEIVFDRGVDVDEFLN